MERLAVMQKASRYFKACKSARMSDKRRMAKDLMRDGVFNYGEISTIVNMRPKTLLGYTEEKPYMPDRKSWHFNPSSLDLFIMVRHALLHQTPLRNAWISVLYEDGNSILVIQFFTGLDVISIRKRVIGEITTEWFNHRKRLGGLKAAETRKRRKAERDRAKRDGEGADPTT